MIKILLSPRTSGTVKAINSKSEAHRLLICASLGDKKTTVECENVNRDILATAECLRALGSDITYENGVFTVTPISTPVSSPRLLCDESGSTLRFLIPLCAYFGNDSVFETKGRLSERPLSPLKEELEKGGTAIETEGKDIKLCGQCNKTEFSIAGNVSSQFISGLMFMLTRTGGTINITGKTESLPYIEMTADALSLFGCDVSLTENKVVIPKTAPLISPERVKSFGDWSNAAFFITAGVIGKEKITVKGLDMNSRQGDKKIVSILKSLGARIETAADSVSAYPSRLYARDIDAGDIPDLVPVLSVAAANAKGTTRIYNCARLRLKESDRIETVINMINALGGTIYEENDELFITGSPLPGGTVDSANDHRIAMSAATAAFSAEGRVEIINAEAVNKSYPSFWDEIQ